MHREVRDHKEILLARNWGDEKKVIKQAFITNMVRKNHCKKYVGIGV